MAGRPKSTKIDLTLSNPQRSFPKIKSYFNSSQDESERQNIRYFAEALFDATRESTTKNIKTDPLSPEEICDLTKNFTSYEKSFLISKIWETIHKDFHVSLLFTLYEDFDVNQQVELFSLLGNSLNSILFEELQKQVDTAVVNLELLSQNSKQEFI